MKTPGSVCSRENWRDISTVGRFCTATKASLKILITAARSRKSSYGVPEHLLHGLLERRFAADRQVGIRLGGKHEFESHRPDRGVELFQHAFERTAALGDIALDAASQARFGARDDERLQVGKPANLGAVQGQNAFEDEVGLRLDAARRGGASVLIELIDRRVHGAAVQKSFELNV